MSNRPKKFNLKTIISIFIVVVVSVILILHMIQQVNYMIYNERKDLLSQLVKTSASTIDDNINSEWRLVDFYVNDVENSLKEDAEVLEYLNNVANSDDYYFFVDEDGKYYCSDGHVGKIVDTKYYYSEDEKIEYLGSLPHLDSEAKLVFRKKLDEIIIAKHNGEDVYIKYCGCVHLLDDLNNMISTLFSGNNNTIIFDEETGVMLYRKFNIGMLIEGYNVYPKYNDDELQYGIKTSDVIERIKNQETTVSLMKINNRDVYICTSTINVSNWSLLMVVDTDFFTADSKSSIFSVLLSMASIVTVFGLAIISAYLARTKIINNQRRIAEQDKVNQALESAYKTKSDFLSYMSHDIRTPINGIIGMAKIGANIEGNSEKTNDCFKKIDTASKHLLSLVNDVLDMSALESGKVVIKEESFNMQSLLNNCLDIVKGQLVDRELKIVDNFKVKHENLIGDDLHLRQVLINILGNALKFTNDGGQITFTANELKQEDNLITYEFTIEDTGIGISEEILEHLFDAYVQGNNRSIYKGSGLGMAISHQFVKMMNGNIEVQSKEGEGSKFTVTLPFKIDENKLADDISGLKILLVEDNELNVEIAKELLKAKGAEVEVARNGKEALDLFEASGLDEYDVILMDMMMPIMGGLEASELIRKSNRQDNNVPIIALSANSFKDDIEATKKAGMNDYASKPIDIDSLTMTIAKVRREYEKIK